MSSLKKNPRAFIDLNHYNIILNFEPSKELSPKALKLFMQGLHHYVYAQYETAAMYFNKVGKESKNDPALINNLACIAYQNGNHDRAKTLFNSIIEQEEQKSIHTQKALLNLGMIHAHAHEFENTSSFFLKISDDSLQPYIANAQLIIALLQEKHENAYELTKAESLQKDSLKAIRTANTLLTLYKLKKHDEALSHFESEFESIDAFFAKPQPEYALIANNFACNLYESGKITDANKLFILAYSLGCGTYNKDSSLYNIGLSQSANIINDQDVLSYTQEDIETYNKTYNRFAVNISDHTFFYITPITADQNIENAYKKPITLLEANSPIQALKAVEELYAIKNINTDLVKINHALLLMASISQLSKNKSIECIKKAINMLLDVQKNIETLDKSLATYFYNNFACNLNFVHEKDSHFAGICNLIISAISVTPWQELYYKNFGIFVIKALRNSAQQQSHKRESDSAIQEHNEKHQVANQ